jgi:short-subunit dehydrogenase
MNFNLPVEWTDQFYYQDRYMQKSILITGCSSGIGLAAATILQKKGYRVFATARKEADVKKLQTLGLESYLLNVNDSNSIRTVLADILTKTNGTLGALFNNAGYGQTGAIEDLNRDLMREQFETNVFGPMELIIQILPIMRKQGYGRIIQNTSILGVIAMPYYGAYNASKFALEGFSNTLRQELQGTSIYVSIIAPGPIKTQFRENAFNTYKDTVPYEQSVHSERYQTIENYFANSHEKHPPFTVTPDKVVDKLIDVLESSKPKAHYYIGIPAHVFAWLRRLLPDVVLDKILIKISQTKMK